MFQPEEQIQIEIMVLDTGVSNLLSPGAIEKVQISSTKSVRHR
jgi:hypothetical protein